MVSRFCRDMAESRAVLRAARVYRALDDVDKASFSPRLRVYRKTRGASRDSLRLHLGLWCLLRGQENLGRLLFGITSAALLYVVSLGLLIAHLLR